MDALGSPHLHGRSRYPHPPPSHHQFVDSDYYHRQFHHPASFPPPPPVPPYGNQPSPPRRHERDLRVPVDDGGGGRLYFPYPRPQDPFPQLPPRVPDQFPLPDDGYPSPRSHPLGQGDSLFQERREGRVLDADRFRVPEDNQDLIRLRWEEDERRRVVASCRGNYYVEDPEGDLVRRKRMRWAPETDPRENFGSLGQRHLNAWDREVDHRRFCFPELLPGSSLGPAYASSPRGARNFVVPEGNRESAVGDWRQLPPSLSSYPDRDRDRRGEIGDSKERHLRPPVLTMRTSGHSYSDMHGEFLENDSLITGHGFQEDCFRVNRGKRKILNNGKDNSIRWSPIKQPAKRPSALSRIQSGVSVWNRIQEKPSFISSPPPSFSPPNNSGKLRGEVSTPKLSFRSNSLVGEALTSSCPTLLSSDGKDHEGATMKKTGKKNLVRKWEELSQVSVPDSLVSEVKGEIPKNHTPDPPQKVSIDSQILDNHRSTDRFSSQNCLADVSGIGLVNCEIGEGTCSHVICVEDEHNSHKLENSAIIPSNLTELTDGKTTEKSVSEDVSMIGKLSEVSGDNDEKEKLLVKLGGNENCTDTLVHFVAQNDAGSSPFTQVNHQASLDVGTVQLPSAFSLVDNDMNEDHAKRDICESGDGYKSTYTDNDIVPSFCEYSSSPLRSTEQIIMSVDCESLTSSRDVILDKNKKCKRQCDGYDHLEDDLAAKQLEESCFRSHSGGESTRSDSPRPVVESSTVASTFITENQDTSTCVVSEQNCQGFNNSCGSIDDGGKQDQRVSRNSLLTLKGPLVLEAGCSQSTKDTGIKPILEKRKNLSLDYSVKQEIMESKAINNHDHFDRKTIASSGLPTVIPSRANLVSSMRETARQRHNMRSKTWHRNNAFSTSQVHLQSKRSSFCKSPRKPGKLQNSYVRKGNSLIRKPSTGPPQLLHAIGTPSKLSNYVPEKNMNLESKTSIKGNLSCLSLPSFERPKTPPTLPLATKLLNSTNPSFEAPCSISDDSIPEAQTDVQGNLLDSASAAVIDPNVAREKTPEPWCAKRMVYVKHKSNQLVAAHGPKSCDSANPLEKNQALASSSDLYYRKNKNQLIRSIFSSCGQDKQDLVAGNTSSDVGRKPTPLRKRLDKAQEKVFKNSTFKHVWTLNGKDPHKKCVSSVPRLKVLPYLIPWKRTMWTNKSSVLRRASHVGSLKWSRSMQRRSKVVNKEAALAVAEVERKKRERIQFSSVAEHGIKGNSALCERSCANDKEVRHTLASRTFCRGSNEYIRIGNGNQLVRDPKKLIRILANEKVRWSLHNARLRLAKKRQYCLFFSRFGKCNKKGGKCPYIHDPSKVAICTKFLSGSCSNASCKLTHKIVPERMPDCSYFLQGLCTNTSCPYRHVNVNPNASVCEGFLKGYCADGDECRKQHSFVCPGYKSTGECLQGSKCKLHHPKIKRKGKDRKHSVTQNNNWGRYFGSSITLVGKPLAPSSNRNDSKKDEDLLCLDGQFTDFISLGPDSNDDQGSAIVFRELHGSHIELLDSALHKDGIDALIKPLRIMKKDYSTTSDH